MVRRKQYREDTLTILTWHNLGFRFGLQFGPAPPEEVDRISRSSASLYVSCREASVSTPNEVPEQLLVEGAISRVVVNAYERNPEARDRCLAVHGSSCCICGVDFGHKYGPVAAGFIHVHHLQPLSDIAKDMLVDPSEIFSAGVPELSRSDSFGPATAFHDRSGDRLSCCAARVPPNIAIAGLRRGQDGLTDIWLIVLRPSATKFQSDISDTLTPRIRATYTRCRG